MSQEPESTGQDADSQRFVVVGPDGMAVTQAGSGAGPQAGSGAGSQGASQADDGSVAAGIRDVTELVEQPAKVMRIGSMIRQLLEEVKAAPVDEAGRTRLASILHVSVAELKDGLAPELDQELDRLVEPFSGPTPSESELRIAQAQLVGWLEGLFSGIQTAIYAQQVAARAQLEMMRRALPTGSTPMPGHEQHPGQGGQDGQVGPQESNEPGHRGGMYL